jgi:hypothetical protein
VTRDITPPRPGRFRTEPPRPPPERLPTGKAPPTARAGRDVVPYRGHRVTWLNDGMFVDAQVGLGTTPFPVARQRLTAYTLDRPALLRDCETALQTAVELAGGDGSSLMPIQVLTAPARHSPGVTMVPVRWLRRAAAGGEMPLLDANLQVTDTGGPVRLTAVASYRPPPPTTNPDPEAAQRAADTVLRTLLRQVAAVIGSVPADRPVATR